MFRTAPMKAGEVDLESQFTLWSGESRHCTDVKVSYFTPPNHEYSYQKLRNRKNGVYCFRACHHTSLEWEPCDRYGQIGPRGQSRYVHFLISNHTPYAHLEDMVADLRAKPGKLPRLTLENSKKSKEGVNYLYNYLLTHHNIKILVGDHV